MYFYCFHIELRNDLQIEFKEILVISSSDSWLKAAKDHGSYTCRYRLNFIPYSFYAIVYYTTNNILTLSYQYTIYTN